MKVPVATLIAIKLDLLLRTDTAISFRPKMGLPNAPEIAECDASTSFVFPRDSQMPPRCQRGWDYRNWCSHVAATLYETK